MDHKRTHRTVLMFTMFLSYQCAPGLSFVIQGTTKHYTSSITDRNDIHEKKNTALLYSKEQSSAVSTPIRPTFEERMRAIALREQTVTMPKPKQIKSSANRGTTTTTLPPHVTEVTTLEQFQNALMDDSNNNKIRLSSTMLGKVTAVRWYAPWCRACRAVEPYFYSMNRLFQKEGTEDRVQFIDIPATSSSSKNRHSNDSSPTLCVTSKSRRSNIVSGNQLHVGFAIPKVPYGHIYHSEYGLVEELKLTTKTVKDFQLILKSYVDMLCELGAEIDPVSGVYQAPYARRT